jgi:hypothetical protein
MVERAKSGTGKHGRTVLKQVPVRVVLHNHENRYYAFSRLRKVKAERWTVISQVRAS